LLLIKIRSPNLSAATYELCRFIQDRPVLKIRSKSSKNNSPFPPLGKGIGDLYEVKHGFELTPEQKDIQKAAREFIQGEYDKEKILEWEQTHTFPKEIGRKQPSGIYRHSLSEEFGDRVMVSSTSSS